MQGRRIARPAMQMTRPRPTARPVRAASPGAGAPVGAPAVGAPAAAAGGRHARRIQGRCWDKVARYCIPSPDMLCLLCRCRNHHSHQLLPQLETKGSGLRKVLKCGQLPARDTVIGWLKKAVADRREAKFDWNGDRIVVANAPKCTFGRTLRRPYDPPPLELGQNNSPWLLRYYYNIIRRHARP